MFSSTICQMLQLAAGVFFFGLTLRELVHFVDKQDIKALNQDPFSTIFGKNAERMIIGALVMFGAIFIYVTYGAYILGIIHLISFGIYWFGMIGIYHRVTSAQKRGNLFRA